MTDVSQHVAALRDVSIDAVREFTLEWADVTTPDRMK